VYRSDDGYVHMSVLVLKAAGIWDESWDVTDGTPFLHHVTRLDARHTAALDQVRVLEAQRDALARDRALHKYTSVSAELVEMRQQIQQLQDDAEKQRAADVLAARKADDVNAKALTLLRNSLATVASTQDHLQEEIKQIRAAPTVSTKEVADLRSVSLHLSSITKQTAADLEALRQQCEGVATPYHRVC
jgi:septation ring formation regulator EzrA